MQTIGHRHDSFDPLDLVHGNTIATLTIIIDKHNIYYQTNNNVNKLTR